MSTIIVITPPPTKPNLVEGDSPTVTEVKKIRLVLESDGSLADQLRAAADLLDGNA